MVIEITLTIKVKYKSDHNIFIRIRPEKVKSKYEKAQDIMPLSEEEKNMVIEDIRNFNKVYEEVFINNLINNIYIYIYIR